MREPIQKLNEDELELEPQTRPPELDNLFDYTERRQARSQQSHLRAVPLEDSEFLEKRPVQLPRPGWTARAAMALAPLYGFLYDVQMLVGKGVRAENHRLTLPGLKRNAPTLKVAFLSDFHLGPSSGRVAARQAWKRVRDFAPDLLLLGGDYLWADARGLPALIRELQRWKWNRPKAGIFAVPGNHDYAFGLETFETAFAECGVEWLRNDCVQLPAPWTDVWLTGSDDTDKGVPDLPTATRGVPAGACEILLAHSPEILAHDTKRFALTLCGDTHGGQVVWPSGDPIIHPQPWSRQFLHGLHRHNGNWLWVSRGIGNVHVPVRCFAPPDVGLFELGGRGATVTR